MGLQEGGKACLMYFDRISRLCEHFLDSVKDLKRKPFSISDVYITEHPEMPEPVNKLKRELFEMIVKVLVHPEIATFLCAMFSVKHNVFCAFVCVLWL